jgi:hypothetical protein
MTGQPGQDNQDRTGRNMTGRNMTGRTGQAEQDRHAEYDRLNRAG